MCRALREATSDVYISRATVALSLSTAARLVAVRGALARHQPTASHRFAHVYGMSALYIKLPHHILFHYTLNIIYNMLP